MVILCDGMVRSASTWSFNVALKLLRSCDPERRVFGLYNESSEVLAAAARPRHSHLVIKSHKLPPAAYELCRTGALKAIFTWRDPYDAAVSCMRMFNFSFEQALGALENALRVWSFHRATESACIVSYAEMMADPVANIERIASYLGLAPEPEKLWQVARETSFRYLQRLSRQVENLGSERVVRKDGYVFDRQTLLHRDHIRDGGIGYGARALNPEQVAALDALMREQGFDFLCLPRWSQQMQAESGGVGLQGTAETAAPAD